MAENERIADATDRLDKLADLLADSEDVPVGQTPAVQEINEVLAQLAPNREDRLQEIEETQGFRPVVKELIGEIHRLDLISDLYHELLYAVGQKYHGETRHQSALRLIRDGQLVTVEGMARLVEEKPEPAQ